MIVLASVVLALIPLVAILYPFLRRRDRVSSTGDEDSPLVALEHRWDAALAGLRDAELERAVGNLPEDAYRQVRRQYMQEAAAVLRAMEVEEQREEELLGGVAQELEEIRRRAIGDAEKAEQTRDSHEQTEAGGRPGEP